LRAAEFGLVPAAKPADGEPAWPRASPSVIGRVALSFIIYD